MVERETGSDAGLLPGSNLQRSFVGVTLPPSTAISPKILQLPKVVAPVGSQHSNMETTSDSGWTTD